MVPLSFTDSDALRSLNSLSSDILSEPLIPLLSAINLDSSNDKFSVLIPCTNFFFFIIICFGTGLRCSLDNCPLRWLLLGWSFY